MDSVYSRPATGTFLSINNVMIKIYYPERKQDLSNNLKIRHLTEASEDNHWFHF